MILNVLSRNLDIEYPIVIERNALDRVEVFFNLDRKVLIITDNGVPTRYSNMVKEKAKEAYIYTINRGELSKNFDNYKAILEFMVENKFTRTDCIVAVGGGVVGDLSGFVASSYMRGIDFYNVPTTLLSQVDSSIGGKCAIDFLGVKNNIGAFKNPNGVLIDSNTLNTLDKREYNAGMAEVIKMSATSNKSLFEHLYNTKPEMLDIDYVIREALMIKKHVVEVDPFERDLRKVLNFGHTIGHAIEALSESRLLHGECVSLGMTYMVDKTIKNVLIDLLSKYNLPTNIDIDTNKVIDLIKLDKKSSGDTITIVYVSKIGEFEFKKIEINDLTNYLK